MRTSIFAALLAILATVSVVPAGVLFSITFATMADTIVELYDDRSNLLIGGAIGVIDPNLSPLELSQEIEELGVMSEAPPSCLIATTGL